VTAAAATLSSPGRRRLLGTLLALSVALNLCFVAGALWTYSHSGPRPSLETRLGRVPAELALDPRQQAAFEKYAGGVRVRIRQMREAVEPLLGEAWAEIAKPDADASHITALFAAAGDKRRGFQRDLATETLSFLAILSPEQRLKFVEIAHHRPKDWGSGPRR
jgi:uncharacterized membrane protein